VYGLRRAIRTIHIAPKILTPPCPEIATSCHWASQCLGNGCTIISLMSRAVSWPLLGPPVLVLIALAEIAARVTPPAVDVSLWCFGAAAVLLAVKLLFWMETEHRAFDRQDRLAAVVMVCAIGMGWYAARQWVRERQFDYLVAVQNADLRLAVNQLAAQILAFLTERSRHAPPPPRPATWDRDEAAFIEYETDTVREFDRRFEKQVRAAHDILAQLGLNDKDLDVFYLRPANTFQMQVIAAKLAALGARVRG
jgi:hypothetical protein